MNKFLLILALIAAGLTGGILTASYLAYEVTRVAVDHILETQRQNLEEEYDNGVHVRPEVEYDNSSDPN